MHGSVVVAAPAEKRRRRRQQQQQRRRQILSASRRACHLTNLLSFEEGTVTLIRPLGRKRISLGMARLVPGGLIFSGTEVLKRNIAGSMRSKMGKATV